jgi:hypothetical protein
MSQRDDMPISLSDEERARLEQVGELLESSRPVPDPNFRGNLRRSLLSGRRPERATSRSYRFLVATYGGLGTLCLVVALAGVLGAGPFAA